MYLVLSQVFLGIVTVTDNTHIIAISFCRWVVIALPKQRFTSFVQEHCGDDYEKTYGAKELSMVVVGFYLKFSPATPGLVLRFEAV